MPRTIKSLEERFWPRVDRRAADDCWPWTSTVNRKGYGKVVVYGVHPPRHLQAHRVAYQLARGPIPAGLCVCHSCDNPPCCNPAHLWVGTNADNNADKIAKGRGRGGGGKGTRPEYCIRCGHHRTDDVWNGTNWRCRPCHKRTAKACRERRRAALSLTGHDHERG